MNRKIFYGFFIGLVIAVLISTVISAHGMANGNNIGSNQDTMLQYMGKMHGSNTNSMNSLNMMNMPMQQMMNNMDFNNNDKPKWYQPQEYITTMMKQGANTNMRMPCR